MEIDKIYQGNNLEVLKSFPDNSVDSVVTDPPYGISFMNKHWDYDVPTVELWQEVYRVLKPGGHMLVACGTRTQHRMAVNIEDAGFEIRDIVAWIYGSGFPKSLDISKAIESKLLNGKSNSVALRKTEQDGDGESYELKGKNNGIMGEDRTYDRKTFEPSTDQAKQYEGWGTALKPAMELWTLARKPFNTSVAENVLKYGTGGLNIDGCRIPTDDFKDKTFTVPKADNSISQNSYGISGGMNREKPAERIEYEQKNARFPANVIHDGSEEVVELFPNDGESSAARFFYCPKASKDERNMGLYGFEEVRHADRNIEDGVGGANPRNRTNTPRKNHHPTVKPIELMRYLVRLITPKGGLVLDPYVGSGTTAIAAKQEKMHYIGIELEKDYVDIAEARIKSAIVEYDIFDFLGDD